jgi:hypothetical protein
VSSDGERALATHIRWAGLVTPVEEYLFALPRRWRFDFAWPEQHVAAEVEGGVWTSGHHSRGRGFEADCEKYNEAAIRGWIVLRFTPGMIDDGLAVATIERALRRAGD